MKKGGHPKNRFKYKLLKSALVNHIQSNRLFLVLVLVWSNLYVANKRLIIFTAYKIEGYTLGGLF